MLRTFARAAYGLYACVAFVAVILVMFCPALIAAPWLPLRRFIGRLAVRTWLLTIGVRFSVRGLDHLPEGPCVVVSNHASYVDGIVLTAALPMRFTFLVQRKIRDWPYVGLIIHRMGSRFVDRENPRAAAAATLGLIGLVEAGGSLAIFPEGTFVAEPGLMPFHEGAFFIAAKTNVPVVPVIMRGTRRFFRDGARWPSWSTIELEVFEPMSAEGRTRDQARALLQQAFRRIDMALGERDDINFAPQEGALVLATESRDAS